jgi:hypothetical protein
MKYIFMAGAPGSKWSSVAKDLYYSPAIDRSDYSDDRTYHHDASGEMQLMHIGAYFDPGMEFGQFFANLSDYTKEECEAEFDRPFSGDGIRIIKSHVFTHHIDFIKKTWPDCPIVLVYRDDNACLDWWIKCGEFGITYPLYHSYYKDLDTMKKIIDEQNTDIGAAWSNSKYGLDFSSHSSALFEALRLPKHADYKERDYTHHDIKVKVLNYDYTPKPQIIKSSWTETKAKSTYHFDPTIVDEPNHAMFRLGNIKPTWHEDLAAIIESSKPATWETRGYKGEGIPGPREDLLAEEYDIERVGADPKMVITNLNWNIPASLHDITEQFGLDDCMERIHIQWPGQVWNRHIDKLQKWCPDDPDRVMRIMIQLTDWQPGQFWEYGNYHWNQWKAGDVSYFDWQNIPHCTANAGHDPRVTFQITGIRTEKTEQFIASLR